MEAMLILSTRSIKIYFFHSFPDRFHSQIVSVFEIVSLTFCLLKYSPEMFHSEIVFVKDDFHDSFNSENML